MRRWSETGGTAIDEYVSRQDVITTIRENGVYGSGYSNEEREDNVIDMIESVPAADVRPAVRGQWIYDCERTMGDGWTYKQRHCSKCGYQTVKCNNFCQHCGADMRVKS